MTMPPAASARLSSASSVENDASSADLALPVLSVRGSARAARTAVPRDEACAARGANRELRSAPRQGGDKTRDTGLKRQLETERRAAAAAERRLLWAVAAAEDRRHREVKIAAQNATAVATERARDKAESMVAAAVRAMTVCEEQRDLKLEELKRLRLLAYEHERMAFEDLVGHRFQAAAQATADRAAVALEQQMAVAQALCMRRAVVDLSRCAWIFLTRPLQLHHHKGLNSVPQLRQTLASTFGCHAGAIR
eukprot:GHVT01060477.1.p1 GENE.GHVT01060477.1~~GHVT01060477.1.p1  ORF type:complete len:252 (-),score=50.20 GHVT01060477.1:1434-2189(-)